MLGGGDSAEFGDGGALERARLFPLADAPEVGAGGLLLLAGFRRQDKALPCTGEGLT